MNVAEAVATADSIHAELVALVETCATNGHGDEMQQDLREWADEIERGEE